MERNIRNAASRAGIYKKLSSTLSSSSPVNKAEHLKAYEYRIKASGVQMKEIATFFKEIEKARPRIYWISSNISAYSRNKTVSFSATIRCYVVDKAMTEILNNYEN